MREKVISYFRSGKRSPVFILAFAMGLMAGLAAVILKNAVHYTQVFLTRGFNTGEANWLYMLYPMVGLLLTVLYVKYLVKDSISHGISKILFAISKKNSLLKSHNMHSSMVASTLTIGFGGSVGLEAPIVLTGSAIGSQIGQYFHLPYKTITLLVACGATGAVAGIFKAPIAGVAFALEVLMIDLTMASLLPLMIAAVTATSVTWLLMGDEVLFTYNLTDVFTVTELPSFLILGLFTGLISIYFSVGLRKIEGWMQKIGSVWMRWLIGGLALSMLLVLFPPLFGEGYDTLRQLLMGNPSEILANSWWFIKSETPWIFLFAISLIILFKVVATAVTTGAGGVGGVFAPSLFLGGISGFFLARLLNTLGWMEVSEVHFTLVGMAGVMAGVMHSPLTAMFLIAEITGGYTLIIPLMITATIAYITAHLVEPHSVYTRRLAQLGELITHNKDKAAMTRMNMKSLIENDFIPVKENQTLGELVQVVALSNRNVFPVLADDHTFLGLIIMERLRPVMFKTELYQNTYCRDLMYMPEYLVDADDTVEEAVRKIQASGKFNLVVLDEGKYIGCVSRARVFSKYREMMKEMAED
ncbi:MAG: chloride channel protein [Bacteroidetes bacterium GWF2_49_14]|nr:MAG: chloride channel protein [Bacteroidetes bacterium GWF2_49_14]